MMPKMRPKYKTGDRVRLMQLDSGSDAQDYDVRHEYQVGMLGTIEEYVAGYSEILYRVHWDGRRGYELAYEKQLSPIISNIVSVFRNRFLELE